MLPLAAKPGLAQIPRTIGYQGVLTDASGSAVPDGDYSLTFRLYGVRTGGNPLWEEGQVVAVAKGVFNVMLGSVVPLALPFDRPYWLGVTVGGGVELSPRIPLTSSGYSFRAASTESIGGITAGGDLTGTYPNPTLAANAVTTAKIADGAVTQAKLAPGVSLPPGGAAGGDLAGMYPNPTIAPGAVGTAKLADNAVTSAKLADGTIGTADIADGAVMAAKLSATGGSDGQVLKLSGGNLAWGTDETGGFELPYQGSINSDWPAFVIADNGQGVAVIAVGTGTLGIAVNGYHQTSGNFGRLGTAQYGVLGQAYGAGVRGQHATSRNFGYLGQLRLPCKLHRGRIRKRRHLPTALGCTVWRTTEPTLSVCMGSAGAATEWGVVITTGISATWAPRIMACMAASPPETSVQWAALSTACTARPRLARLFTASTMVPGTMESLVAARAGFSVSIAMVPWVFLPRMTPVCMAWVGPTVCEGNPIPASACEVKAMRVTE